MDNFTKFLTKKTLLPTYLTKPLYITSIIKRNVLIVKEFLFYFKIQWPKDCTSFKSELQFIFNIARAQANLIYQVVG